MNYGNKIYVKAYVPMILMCLPAGRQGSKIPEGILKPGIILCKQSIFRILFSKRNRIYAFNIPNNTFFILQPGESKTQKDEHETS